jgi:hypothetical protein
MNFERIDAVLHSRHSDVVPFAPYDNLIPRAVWNEPCAMRAWACARASAPSGPECARGGGIPDRRRHGAHHLPHSRQDGLHRLDRQS